MPLNPPPTPIEPTINYNGYQFSSRCRSQYSISYIYDDTNRVVTGSRHVLTVNDYLLVANLQDGDQEAEIIRRLLSEPQRELRFVAQGHQGLIVNSPLPNSFVDIDFGPKPEILEWRKIGRNLCHEYTWRCTVTLNECSPKVMGRIRKLSESVSYSVSNDGYLTISISGSAAITNNTKIAAGTGVANIPTVEILKLPLIQEAIYSKPLEGFVRTSSNWSVNAAQTEVTYSYTDVEVPNCYPKGCVDFSYSDSSSIAKGASTVGVATRTLTCNYTIDRGNPLTQQGAGAAGIAYRNFLGFIDKVKVLKDGIVVIAFSVSHSGPKPRFTFSMTYTFLASINTMLVKTKLGQVAPFSDTDPGIDRWQEWQDSTKGINRAPVPSFQNESFPRSLLSIPLDPRKLFTPCVVLPPETNQGNRLGASQGLPTEVNVEDIYNNNNIAFLRYDVNELQRTDTGFSSVSVLPTGKLSELSRVNGSTLTLKSFAASQSPRVSRDNSSYSPLPSIAGYTPIDENGDQQIVVQRRHGNNSTRLFTFNIISVNKPPSVPQLTLQDEPQDKLKPGRATIKRGSFRLPGGLMLYSASGSIEYIIGSPQNEPNFPVGAINDQ